MAFTFDDKKDVGESSSSPITTTYAVATDGLLIVHISVDSSGTPRAGGAPTFDGSALTQVTGSPVYSGAEGYAELWYHLTPTTGGTPTLSVPNTGTLNCHVKVSSYISSTGGSALGDAATASGNSAAASVTSPTPGANGAVHVDSMFGDDRDVPSANNRILLYKADAGSEVNACQYYLQTADAAALMEYTMVRADEWAIVAASFVEATAPTNITLSTASVSASGQVITVQSAAAAVNITLDTASVTANGQIASPEAHEGVIVEIGHEEGDFSDYDSTVNSGDMAVNSDAAMVGDYGLSVTLDGSQSDAYGVKNFSITTNTMRFRFYLDPNTLSMSSGDEFGVLGMHTTPFWAVFIFLHYVTDHYEVQVTIKDDENLSHTFTYETISDASHYLEILLERESAPGQDDGTATLWIDGVEASSSFSDIGNYTIFRQFDYLRLGATFALEATTTGAFYLDDLIIRDDDTEIGSAGENIALGTASLSASGQLTTITPGAVSTALATAIATAAGQIVTIDAGGILEVVLSTANIIANGQVISVVPSGVSKALGTASLTADGQAVSIVPGAVTKGLNTALLVTNGQALGVVPGEAIAGLGTASLVASGQALNIVPGSVSKALATALINSSGQTLGIVPGAVSKELSTAILIANGQLLSVVPGGVVTALNTAVLTADGQIIVVSIGDAPVNVNLDTALLNADGQVIVIIPGAASIALNTAQAATTGQATTIIPGAVSMALASAAINAVGQALTIVPGAANVSLSTAVTAANGQQVTITIGFNIELGTATISADGQVIAIVPGAVSTAMQTATISASGIPISFLQGGVSVGLNTAALEAGGQSIQVLPGVFVVSLETASVFANGQQVGVVPGAISVMIDTATLIASGQNVDVSALAEIIAIVKEWTLRTRSTNLSLENRSNDFSLESRNVDLNLVDRDTGLTLSERLLNWSLKNDDR